MPIWRFGHSPDIENLRTRRDVEGLIKALSYPKDGSVRRAAAEALGGIFDKRAIEPLLITLQDSDAQVCGAAAKALGSLRDARAVEPLLVALKHSNSDVRRLATIALDRIRDARAVEPLLIALRDSDAQVCRAAAEALGRFRDARAVEPLLVALKHSDSDVRRLAAWALGEIGAVQAVEPLLLTLHDNNAEVSKWAAAALGRIGDARAVEPLFAALSNNNVSAAWALAELGDARAVEPLLAVLSTDKKNKHMRDAVRNSLKKIGTAAFDPLVTMLQYSDTNVRGAAAKMLQELGWQPPDDSQRVLFAIVLGDPKQLTDLGPNAVEALLTVLERSDSDGRRVAVKTLGQMRDSRAIEPLVALLEDHDTSLRYAVAEALRKLDWQPASAEHRAKFLIVLGKWDEVASMGILALKPLLQETRHLYTSREKVLPMKVVERIVQNSALDRIDIETLIELSKLSDITTTTSETYWIGDTDFTREHEEVSDYLKVRQLAIEELKRRGVTQ